MIFTQSLFGEYCSVFLNNFQSPLSKYNELAESYQTLKKILISGQTKFPKLNLQLEELIDINNLTYFNVFAKLTWQYNNSVNGFSKTKLYEKSNSNIDLVLDDLESEYKNIVIQLQSIYDLINKNINDYKLLIYILTNIDVILKVQTTFDTFDLYNTIFRFLYEKKPLSSTYPFKQHDDTELNSIPTIITYALLKKLLISFNPFTSAALEMVYMNKSLDEITHINHFLDSFNNYIDLNLSNICHDLITFIDNTIYNYGINVSPGYLERANSVLSELIVKVKDIAEKNLMIVSPVDYIYRLINGTIENAIVSTLLENLLTHNSILTNLEEYSLYDINFHDKLIIIQEPLIAKNIAVWMSKHIEQIQLINYIHTKFASNPIFALNAHAIVYAKFALNFLEDSSIFTNDDIESWLNVLLSLSDTHINNIIQLCSNYKIELHNEDYNFNAFLILQEFVTSLVECDDFTKFIIEDFIPTIDTFISHEYKSLINWYKKIDDIKYIFKLILCNDILAGLAGDSTKLFANFKSIFLPIIENSLSTATYSMSKEAVRPLIRFEQTDVNKWYNVFNSFFKNATITKYVSIFLKENYSI